MPTDASFDLGLISPVSAGRDQAVSDAAILAALVGAEAALIDALVAEGVAPEGVAGERLRSVALDAAALARDAVAGGNPVIPLIAQLRAGADEEVRPWIHRGATSQDILDTALMIVARDAVGRIRADLARVSAALEAFADDNRDLVAAGRTLTQHAVPTTIGLRAANWRRGVDRALARLDGLELPAQLGGAAGTMAAMAEVVRASAPTQRSQDGGDEGRRAAAGPDTAQIDCVVLERVQGIRRGYAAAAGLRHLDAPWHTQRWPVTELGDALAQAIDALGKIATDVATASRTEIGELAEPTGGGSSAMPQKRNPARSVLIRSAALRAPQLAATLHLASALAADERPDGAWHAEWPALRELLRLALGAGSHAADLAEGLRVDRDAVARNLTATGGLIVSERLGAVLGRERAAEIVARVTGGAGLASLVDPELLDPSQYLGLAGLFTDQKEHRDRS
ncbi:lyase family protein [Microbacterium karelineae]|uniref:lyase family protein n=1 Tax=Microbacterium karelineae TaxID=2654283 RepID=UPI0012E9EF9C|nr:lyase family protein [Microbacterium karelineae]